MKKNEVIEVLRNAGYQVEEVTNIKNGKEKQGISIRKEGSCVAPVLYEENIKGIEDEAQLIAFTAECFYKAPDEDFSKLEDFDSVKDFIFIGAEPLINQNRYLYGDKIVKFDSVKDIVFYLYINLDCILAAKTFATTRIKKDFLEKWGVTEDELFEIAALNTRKNTQICTMTEMLLGFGNLPEEVKEDLINSEQYPMWVISNKQKVKGAGILYCEEYFSYICNKYDWQEITVIPSSIHELIIIPTPTKKADINSMIHEVNETQVAETDYLADKCFIFNNDMHNFVPEDDLPF
ncbi:MAG: DUF5688 family protein [Lachnospiraceae bacterium]|nr:DUF5688 family protein [Lachnospiraceae bacterium]